MSPMLGAVDLLRAFYLLRAVNPLRAVTTLGILLISACASTPDDPLTAASWERHQQKLDALEQYTVSGKVALRTPEQSETATLLWRQTGRATRLELSGPLGLGASTIVSDGATVEIRKGEDISRWKLNDPALATNQGLPLPLAALNHWLKGVPAPQLDIEGVELDPQSGLPRWLQQDNWTVSYQSFGQFEGYILPTRLEIQGDQSELKIILRQWRQLGAQ